MSGGVMQYYTPALLELAGFRDSRTALLVAMLPAAVNSLGTLVGLLQIDKNGRRQVIAHNHVITQTLQVFRFPLSAVLMLMQHVAVSC